MSYRRGLNRLSYEALNAAYPGDGTGAEMHELMKAEMAGTAWELGLRLAKFVRHVKSLSAVQETCPLVCAVGLVGAERLRGSWACEAAWVVLGVTWARGASRAGERLARAWSQTMQSE